MSSQSDPRTSAPSGILPNKVTNPTGDKPSELILNQFQYLLPGILVVAFARKTSPTLPPASVNKFLLIGRTLAPAPVL